jgi:hypothetical protein
MRRSRRSKRPEGRRSRSVATSPRPTLPRPSSTRQSRTSLTASRYSHLHCRQALWQANRPHCQLRRVRARQGAPLVAAAGKTRLRPLQMSHQMTDKAFDLMLNIHLTAPFRLIRAAAPYMRSQDPAVLKTNRCIVCLLRSPLHQRSCRADQRQQPERRPWAGLSPLHARRNGP